MNASLLRILIALTDGEGSSGDLLDRLRRMLREDAPSLATFYRRLKEGLDHGWIEVIASSTHESGPGRPAQIFRLSAAGRVAAREEAARWRAVSERMLGSEESAG